MTSRMNDAWNAYVQAQQASNDAWAAYRAGTGTWAAYEIARAASLAAVAAYSAAVCWFRGLELTPDPAAYVLNPGDEAVLVGVQQ